jgi:hypothetical protein
LRRLIEKSMTDDKFTPSQVNMLWIGDALGRIELLSIASWLAHGHAVRLHTYGSVANIPSGVEVADARMIAPYDRIAGLRHRETGSYSLAADYFRYRLQSAGMGLWSDLDVVCLKPVQVADDCLFGLQDDKLINCAVLYLPPGLAMTAELEGLFRDNFIPPWTRARPARKLRLKRLFGRRVSPGDLPWGTFGPNAVTELARKHGLSARARPRHVFYPLGYEDAHRVFDPAFSLQPLLREDTLTLHLWNEMLRNLRHTQPPPGSPLASLYARFGV